METGAGVRITPSKGVENPNEEIVWGLGAFWFYCGFDGLLSRFWISLEVFWNGLLFWDLVWFFFFLVD